MNACAAPHPNPLPACGERGLLSERGEGRVRGGFSASGHELQEECHCGQDADRANAHRGVDAQGEAAAHQFDVVLDGLDFAAQFGFGRQHVVTGGDVGSGQGFGQRVRRLSGLLARKASGFEPCGEFQRVECGSYGAMLAQQFSVLGDGSPGIAGAQSRAVVFPTACESLRESHASTTGKEKEVSMVMFS